MTHIIGLTGGIAMGKSTLASRLKWIGRQTGLGLWLNDADQIVHRLMRPGGRAYAPIIEAFGQDIIAAPHQPIDRAALGRAVFSDPALRRKLEGIVHPLVYRETRQFLIRARRLRMPMVVLDIPLLFETYGEARCDTIFSVHCASGLQRRRALARPAMTTEKLEGILCAQVPARHRRKHSDFVIPTGAGVALTLRYAIQVLGALKAHKALDRPRRYQQLRRHRGGRGPSWPPMHRRNGFFKRPKISTRG